MLLLFPSCPDEITIGGEGLLCTILPPVALLKHAFHDGEVVAGTHVELLRLIDLVV